MQIGLIMTILSLWHSNTYLQCNVSGFYIHLLRGGRFVTCDIISTLSNLDSDI
jgi:hypothetical protein